LTSSGTYNFAPSTGQLVLNAFSRINLRPAALLPEMLEQSALEANLLLAEWANKGVNLWKTELQSVALSQGDDEYTLPARTVSILAAYVRTTVSSQTNDRLLNPISTYEYSAIPSKSIEAPPTVFWFNRQITPVIKLWPVPDDGGPYTLLLQTMVQVQDANLPSGETPDIPYRWYDAFTAGLSYRLSRIYAQQLEGARKGDYMEAWETAAAEDTEDVPVYIFPALGQYYR
jgi:hypothetical protein